MSLSVQFYTLLMMLFSGLAMGFMYDVYRVLAEQLKFPRWLVIFTDLLYWLIVTLFVFDRLVESNQGQLRVVILLPIFVGGWIYFKFISFLTVGFVVWLLGVIRKLIWFCRRCIEIFVIKPIIWLWKCILVLFGFIQAVGLFIYRILYKIGRGLGYPVWILLKRLWNKIF